MIIIQETTHNDLKNIQSLWADGDVMKFVGFPKGLHKTDKAMNNWYNWIESSRPLINHYSIYDDDVYCGETFYRIDPTTKRAALDIKLFKSSQGKGIAYMALKYAITEAFNNGAISAYVDPHPKNTKAISLYQRIGMTQMKTPDELFNKDFPDVLYFEIHKK